MQTKLVMDVNGPGRMGELPKLHIKIIKFYRVQEKEVDRWHDVYAQKHRDDTTL